MCGMWNAAKPKRSIAPKRKKIANDGTGSVSDPETTRIYAKVRNGRLARAMTGRKEAPAEPEETEDVDEIEALRRQVAALTDKLDKLMEERDGRE